MVVGRVEHYNGSKGRIAEPGRDAMTEQVKDIVCGAALEPDRETIHIEYGGQLYYFCSEACKTRFERNPGDFVSNL